ncbi:MAG: segregation/condensation protein A [Desulfobacterales bacterium]|nr:segregation/condensation protein A [Desulfobacterales bacterium]
MDYEVKLEIFEGPMDLLLHLIHKNELDIFDIPIATITDQYLGYLDMMKALNIDVAGDFLVMAATLIHIKSRMLLPDSGNEEEEDPRVELTRPLLEYMRFKEVAENLSERELLDRDIFARQISSYSEARIRDEDSQLDVNLFQLMDAFKRIVNRKLPGVQLKLELDEWSVEEQTEVIITRLKETGNISFEDVFSGFKSVSQFIVSFLAILELVHLGLIKVLQTSHEGDIRLVASFDENEGDSSE